MSYTGFYSCKYGYVTDLDDLFVQRDFSAEGGMFSSGSNYNIPYGVGCSSSNSAPCWCAASHLQYRPWKQISIASSNQGFAIDCKGGLWAWGLNCSGNLGVSSTVGYSTPIQVSSACTWKCVNTSGFSAGAIRDNGTLWMWGDNTAGQLGDNSTATRSAPVQVIPTSGVGSNCWKEFTIDGGSCTSFGIKTDGTLWSWGSNVCGILGASITLGTNKSTPVQIGSSTDWWRLAKGFGSAFMMAIKCDGSLWVWGRGCMLGQETTVNRSSPVQLQIGTEKFCSATVGGFLAAAVAQSGRLYVWGCNQCGALGINSTVCEMVCPRETCCNTTDWKCVQIRTAAIISARSPAMMALKKDGTAWAWGFHCFCASLGTGVTNNVCYLTPVQVCGGSYIDLGLPNGTLSATYILKAETAANDLCCYQYYWNFYT
jgi:alpha-tubulin suppressor-like RCC1 family protein